MSGPASMTAPDPTAWRRARRAVRAALRLFAGPAPASSRCARAGCSGWAGWHLLEWGVVRRGRRARLRGLQGRRHGACWGFVAEKWRLILFGRYPYEQQWRPALATGAVLAMLVASALPALWSRRGARVLAAGWAVAFALFFALMAGGVFGLEPVGTDRWGGLPLTVILTLIGIAASAPIGVLLALARRSSLALLRTLAVGYIELVRGVPLITVLFVAAFIFPLLLPAGWRLDPFWRVVDRPGAVPGRVHGRDGARRPADAAARADRGRPRRSACATGSCSAR